MKKYSEEQIFYALKEVETGTPMVEVIRRMGISEQTFYRWKQKYGAPAVGELRRLKQLEDENRKLKQGRASGVRATSWGPPWAAPFSSR